MKEEIEALRAAVEETRSTEASAAALIAGLVEKLEAAIGAADMTAVTELTQALKEANAPLAAAVAANALEEAAKEPEADTSGSA